jgi:hypothetical protein
MNDSGPDVAPIQCYTPDGCCGASLCLMTLDQFICQIRSLLPEGDLWNNTLPSAPPAAEIAATGVITVGCTTVGCSQLVYGGCCEKDAIPCDIEPTAPQLAVLDSFSAGAYGAIQSLCRLLPELDPCRAQITLRHWAERFGIIDPDDRCAPDWSDHVLAILICIMLQIRLHTINWDYLQQLAARFGAEFVVRYAGDFSECHPAGWWTMARNREDCPPAPFCPPGEVDPRALPWIQLVPECDDTPPLSLNLILSPADIKLPPNCNNPPVPDTLPHDEELYSAFKWLLPRILPQPVFWCVYERDLQNCIQ